MRDSRKKKRASYPSRHGIDRGAATAVAPAQAALLFLEALSDDQLRQWLREAIWIGITAPIQVPSTSMPASYLGDFLSRGSIGLVVRLRDIIPRLVQEWSDRDSGAAESLDRLLILCGSLRCVGAEPEIVRITRDRLERLPERVELRARCLAVLAGFGCTERTVLLFKAFIQYADYAALCYRALYRYDRSYAASQLQQIMTALRDAREDLVRILQLLFFVELRPPESGYVVERMLAAVSRSSHRSVLALLRNVGLRIEPPLSGLRDYFELALYPPKELRLGLLQPQRLHLSGSVKKSVIDDGVERPTVGFERKILENGWLHDADAAQG